MNSVQDIFDRRVKRLATSMNLQEPDCVGIMPMIGPWAAHIINNDSLSLAFDYQGLSDVFLNIAREFDLDAINPPTGCRWGPIYSSLGSTEFSFYNEKGAAHPSLHHIGRTNMHASEYPELIADAYRFICEKLLPRKYPALNVPEPRRSMILAKGAIQFSDYQMNGLGPLIKRMREEFGMPVYNSSATLMPLDLLADYFRGFTGITLDIRRRPDDVLAACEALVPLTLACAIGNREAQDFPTTFIPLHIPTYLKPKDFETFYFPTFKAMIAGVVKAGRRVTLFMEGNWLPYVEFFQELPKGKVNGIFEYGDALEMKKGFGNVICLIGGMPVQLLNYGTRQEVIDHTRRLIDDMAPGGGWILGMDKSMLAPNDGNPDNMKAMIETVRKYGVYK